jgi:hypothetical protein
MAEIGEPERIVRRERENQPSVAPVETPVKEPVPA